MTRVILTHPSAFYKVFGPQSVEYADLGGKGPVYERVSGLLKHPLCLWSATFRTAGFACFVQFASQRAEDPAALNEVAERITGYRVYGPALFTQFRRGLAGAEDTLEDLMPLTWFELLFTPVSATKALYFMEMFRPREGPLRRPEPTCRTCSKPLLSECECLLPAQSLPPHAAMDQLLSELNSEADIEAFRFPFPASALEPPDPLWDVLADTAPSFPDPPSPVPFSPLQDTWWSPSLYPPSAAPECPGSPGCPPECRTGGASA